MKKISLLLASLLLSSGNADASVRSSDEMQEAARNALLRQINYSRILKTRKLDAPMHEIFAEDHLHIFASEGAGAVVVCDDDRYNAVMGVCDSYYTDSELPDGLRYYIQQANRNIAAGHKAPAMAPLADVPNFMPTIWGQRKPYNTKVPKIGGTNPPVGCVALSMAQSMYCFGYPTERPVFDKNQGDYYELAGKRVPYSTPAETPLFKEPTEYDWSLMLTDYSGEYTTAQAQAVQMLNFDCGVAVHMNYDLEGSGTKTFYVPEAMTKHFGYDPLSVSMVIREFYTDEEWCSLIYDEMQKRCPILYAANSADQGAHAFNFSGLQPDGKVYVNWGWNGDFNGWYDINLLKPTNDKTSMGTFDESQNMIIGMRPTPAHESGLRQPTSTSLIGIDGAEMTAKDGDVLVQAELIYNLHWRDFEGDIALVMIGIDNPEWMCGVGLMNEESEPLPFGYGWQIPTATGYFSLFEEDDLTELTPGNYYMAYVSQATDEEAFQIGRLPETGRGLWRVTIEDHHRVTAVELVKDQTEIDIFTSVAAPKTSTMSVGSDAIYNLAGQRVSKGTRGIVISNGKKMLVK